MKLIVPPERRQLLGARSTGRLELDILVKIQIKLKKTFIFPQGAIEGT